MAGMEFQSIRDLGARVIFDLRLEAPDLYARFRRRYRGVAGFAARLEDQFPVPGTCFPFAGSHFIRPPRHSRAFYLCAKQLPRRQPELTPIPGGTLAFKGAEPLAADIGQGLAGLASERVSLQSRLNHFALHEQKIPLAVSVPEVLSEARTGIEVQRVHVAAYDDLAHLPLPILALAWPTAVVDRHRARVVRFLTTKSRSQLEDMWGQGLGLLCYAYPTLPVRVLHWTDALRAVPTNGSWFDKVAVALHRSPLQVVEGWLRTTARLLCLRYFPTSLDNTDWTGEGRGLGQACNPNNAVLDGGFVDVDSITSFSTHRNRADLLLNAELSMRELLGTIRAFLVGHEQHRWRGDIDTDVFIVERYAQQRLVRLVQAETRRGARPDPHVQRFLEGDPLLIPTVLASAQHRRV